MNAGVHVSEVRFTPASARQRDTGLLGWIHCRIGELSLDGLALRRTRSGHFTISYPARRDTNGRQRFPIRPADDASRVAIETAIFDAIGLNVESAR